MDMGIKYDTAPIVREAWALIFATQNVMSSVSAGIFLVKMCRGMNRIHDRGTKHEARSIDRLPPDDLCILVSKKCIGGSLGYCRKRKLKSVPLFVTKQCSLVPTSTKMKSLVSRSSTAYWGSRKRGSPLTTKFWESMRTRTKRNEALRQRRRREQRQGSPHEERLKRRRAGLTPAIAVPRPSRPCSGEHRDCFRVPGLGEAWAAGGGTGRR